MLRNPVESSSSHQITTTAQQIIFCGKIAPNPVMDKLDWAGFALAAEGFKNIYVYVTLSSAEG